MDQAVAEVAASLETHHPGEKFETTLWAMGGGMERMLEEALGPRRAASDEQVRRQHRLEMQQLKDDPEAFFRMYNTKYWKNTAVAKVEEVDEVVRTASSVIVASWTRLNKLVSAHEELIRKRWLKKSKKARSDLLIRVFPKISKVKAFPFTADHH